MEVVVFELLKKIQAKLGKDYASQIHKKAPFMAIDFIQRVFSLEITHAGWVNVVMLNSMKLLGDKKGLCLVRQIIKESNKTITNYATSTKIFLRQSPGLL